MQKVSLSNKVFTENPLLDEIVYNARQIATGVVIKDSDMADNNETLDSAPAGDILIAINKGVINFESFDYDIPFLSIVSEEAGLGYTQEQIVKYAFDNTLIPKEDRQIILDKAIDIFTATYVEYNNYYRMLHGEPDYDESEKWKGLYICTDAIDVTNITPISYISTYKVDYSYELIHKLPLASKNIIYENGTCENIINNYNQIGDGTLSKDDVLYVMHIGDREVEYVDARVAEKFALLYCPSCDAEEVRRRFKELFEANRKYLLYTIYSDAYKFRSDYYDNFMMIFLVIQTIIDMVVELPEYIIRRDIFDTRTCKYIFESNGVKYFKDIPLKYQVALVKNLNKLIKFKSTDKCIVDIVSLFGTENIEVFKYYIMKDRNANIVYDQQTKEHSVEYYDNKTTAGTEDNDTNYDIKFIKVPLLDSYDNYIRSEINEYSYDTMVDGDEYWTGDKDYQTVKSEIKDLDFTVLRSKYYSIEAVIDIAKRNFTLVYFMNMILYHDIDESELKVSLPNISTTQKFELIDVILTLYSLSYIYYGVEDTILDSRAKAAQILGFDLNADMNKIASWLEENHKGLTLKDLHIDGFMNYEKLTDAQGTEGRIVTFKQLQNAFFTNKDIYDHVISVMTNPPSKEIYNAYRYVYKALLTTNRNMEYFLDDKTLVNTYKALGYKVYFNNIPRRNEYSSQEMYEEEYKWFVENAMDYTKLLFDMDDNFDDNHKFNLYIKETINNSDILTKVGEVVMSSTYSGYLSSKDAMLYSFIVKIKSITDVDARQEACINAIQSIVSYLKDYITEIDLNVALSSLPSIALDFIKKYVSEVIDFFKSFKIFTHGSSIIYVITDKFNNYVQLIEHILLKYLLDKSELVKIEDIIEGKAIRIGNLDINQGNGMTSIISPQDRYKLIDKIWVEISRFVEKYYSEYYNSTQYEQAQLRIRDYSERFSTYNLNTELFTEHYIKEIEDYAVHAIVEMLVDIYKNDKFIITDSTSKLDETREFNEYLNEWIADLMYLKISMYKEDIIPYQDDILSVIKRNLDDISHILDGNNNIKSSNTFKELSSIRDTLFTIITQSN